MIFLYVFIFVFGLVVGSFLNVVINRLKTKESIFKSRSHCLFCKKQLTWYELIPILSFIIQKAKCKKCKKKISWQYPLVEFFTGLIFVLIVFYFFDFTFFSIINICFLFLISCFLIILFVYDLKHYLVPDEIIYPAVVLTLGFGILELGSYLLAGFIGGFFFLLIVAISKGRWMGVGDIKIGVLMGLLLGLSNLLTALFLAFLSGAIVSTILLILKRKTLKSEIPFGPFLVGATFITLFWGDFLVNWYLGLFI